MRVLGIFPSFRFFLFFSVAFRACVRIWKVVSGMNCMSVRWMRMGNDLTGNGVLQKSDIYLFNEQGFVRMIPSEGILGLFFGEDRDERLTLVAWGNLKEDTLITTEIAPGTSPERCETPASAIYPRYAHSANRPVLLSQRNREISTRGWKERYYARNGTYGGGPQYTHALSCRTLSL